MRRHRRFRLFGGLMTLTAALLLLATFALAAPSGKGSHGRRAQHVRWDIASVVGGNPPGPINPGGHASATAPDGDTITMTGSGTFVAPASGKGSRAARGGGTWTTSMGARGTYRVKALVSWTFANFWAATPMFVDNIDRGRRTNGTAVLRIAFSDGSTGVLTVGCHGPGAPPGIFEGIATTKGYKTYYAVQAPAPGVDANRTIFHLRR